MKRKLRTIGGVAVAVMTTLVAMVPDLAANAASRPSGMNDGALRVNCQAEYHGPRVERDQFGFWVDYGVKYYCSRPEDFKLRVSLQQHTGNGWITVESEVNQGVSGTPWVDGGIQCRHETHTTYRFTIEGRIGSVLLYRNGPIANLPCSL